MSTFYIDLYNGDDANDGSSWANAWKTITNGATAARIAPGDEIRISKTPDPVSIGNATWTDLSKTITLATAQTLTIDNCETAWTASANITATADGSYRKQGTYAEKLVVAAGFTTGKMAYKTLTEVDLSSYQKISFWFRNDSVAVTINYLKICLCSDTAGDTIVDTFYVPAIPSTGRWVPLAITKDGGGNLGSSIQSIAIYADTDPGAPTIYLDNIIACTTNGINIQSLISKNGSAKGGTDGYYGIQSIDGTTILLDNEPNTLANAGRGYSGTTETVESFIRETYKTPISATTSTIQGNVNDNGTAAAHIRYIGGYNTTNNSQDGETYLDGSNGYGYGLYFSSKSFIEIEYLNMFRYYYGYNVSSNSFEIYFSNISNCSNNNGSGIICSYVNLIMLVSLANANNNGNYGIMLSNSYDCIVYDIKSASNNIYSGIHIGPAAGNKVLSASKLWNNGITGINLQTADNNIFYNINTKNNGSAGIGSTSSINYLRNALLQDTVECTLTSASKLWIWSLDHDTTEGNNWGFTYFGTVNWQTTTKYGSDPGSWKTTALGASRGEHFKIPIQIGEFAGVEDTPLTISVWVKKDHATNVGCRLVCFADSTLNISEVSDTKANDTDWEQLSITLNSSHPNPVFKVFVESWYISGVSNTYAGSISVS